MALKINEACDACGTCVPECPQEAITPTKDGYAIDRARCSECVGVHAEPQCEAVCQMHACVNDDDHPEREQALLARARAEHPERVACGANG